MIPEQRFENVDASVRKYLDTGWRVSSVLRTPIEWQDSPFPEASTANEWIQPVMLNGDGQFFSNTSNGRSGKRLNAFLNVNIFMKKAFVDIGDPLRRFQLVDLLFDLFKENTAIDWKDYNGSTTAPTALGKIACFEFKDQQMPPDDKKALYQHNVSVRMFVLQERAK